MAAYGLLSCQLPTLTPGGATGYCPVCSREVGLTGTQIGLAVANGGLGQEVCEFLQGRLLVAGSGPQLRGQEPVGCLEGVEGCLHDAQTCSAGCQTYEGCTLQTSLQGPRQRLLEGHRSTECIPAPYGHYVVPKALQSHHAALKFLSLTCCTSMKGRVGNETSSTHT